MKFFFNILFTSKIIYGILFGILRLFICSKLSFIITDYFELFFTSRISNTYI